MAKTNPLVRFDELSRANRARLPVFRNKRGKLVHKNTDGSDWKINEWTNAIAGEAGEACNLAKKLRRGDFGEPGDKEYSRALRKLSKEFADIVIYTDLACAQIGYSLGDVVVNKFNEVSKRIKCDVTL